MFASRKPQRNLLFANFDLTRSSKFARSSGLVGMSGRVQIPNERGTVTLQGVFHTWYEPRAETASFKCEGVIDQPVISRMNSGTPNMPTKSEQTGWGSLP
jgi:hypothetical protein